MDNRLSAIIKTIHKSCIDAPVGTSTLNAMLKIKEYRYHISYNVFLITVGAVIVSLGLKAIAFPHGLITGGVSGLCLLLYYFTGTLSPGLWYFIVNLPLFALGCIFISKRFFFYSGYGMLVVAIAIDLIKFEFGIKEPMLAVLASGVLLGGGSGIVLHSLGSLGGSDILGVILNQRFNLRIGTFYFLFDSMVFTFSLAVMELERILYSLVLTFIVAKVLDYVLGMFNQRKMVMVISDRYEEIIKLVFEKIRHGATLLDGLGAYSGKRKKIILIVVNNYELKRVEECVFTVDPKAFVITESAFNVLGEGFSRPKVY